MNKKGFTLVELIGVVVILGLIALIAFPALLNQINTSKNEVSESVRELVISSSKSYVEDDTQLAPKKYCITLEELIDGGYLTEGIVSSERDKLQNKRVMVTYYNNKYNYELVDSKDCYICKGVKAVTVDDATVPTGQYNTGDEYTCEVKKGTEYNFFVISSDENNVNLLMDSNVNYYGESVKLVDGKIPDDMEGDSKKKGLVAFISEADYLAAGGLKDDFFLEGYGTGNLEKGPITVLNYLNFATSFWTNIENLNEVYDYSVDKNGYTIRNELQSLEVRLNGKSRLMTGTELFSTGFPFVTKKWMTVNLNPISEKEGIYGYWNLAPYGKYDVWNVNSDGGDADGTITIYDEKQGSVSVEADDLSFDNYCGVRPVITVSKSMIYNDNN